MSRRVHEPTEHNRLLVKYTAGKMTQAAIATVLGISKTTLHRFYKDELQNGKAHTDALAIGQQYKLLKQCHPASVMFYLKTQCGWRETGEKDAPTINVTIGKDDANL